MSEITNELKTLAESDIPLGNGTHRDSGNLLKITGLLLAICVLGAFITAMYAFWTSVHNENEIQDELACVRNSSVAVDQAIGEGIAHLIVLDDTLFLALNAVSQRDEQEVKRFVNLFPKLAREGELVKVNLSNSIINRKAANERC